MVFEVPGPPLPRGADPAGDSFTFEKHECACRLRISNNANRPGRAVRTNWDRAQTSRMTAKFADVIERTWCIWACGVADEHSASQPMTLQQLSMPVSKGGQAGFPDTGRPSVLFLSRDLSLPR